METINITCSSNRGFFSLFKQVMELVGNEPDGTYRIEIFSESYADSRTNLWDLFFENDLVKDVSVDDLKCLSHCLIPPEDVILLKDANKIIRLLKLKSFMLNTIDDYFLRNLAGRRVLGVHFRGTDMLAAGNTLEDRSIKNKCIKRGVNEYFEFIDENMTNYDTMFLATDDSDAYVSFKERYSDKLLSYSNIRSVGISLQCSSKDRLESLREVIVEVWLLSRCDFLLHGISNIPHVVKILNPTLPSKNLDLIRLV